MPKLLYTCLSSLFASFDITATFNGAFDQARYYRPHLSGCALYAWSLAAYEDSPITFAEIGRFEQELDRLALRNGWFDTSIEDVLPDICCIMTAQRSGYRRALHELLRLWANGQRYAGTDSQRSSAMQRMSKHILDDWLMQHDKAYTAKIAAWRTQQGFNKGNTTEQDGKQGRRYSQSATGTAADDGREDRTIVLLHAYNLLGISADAPLSEVKAAYRRLMMQWHPDKLEMMADELKEFATKKVTEINFAYSAIVESHSGGSS
jgi:DnaJ-domain-containing protein 1